MFIIIYNILLDYCVIDFLLKDFDKEIRAILPFKNRKKILSKNMYVSFYL